MADMESSGGRLADPIGRVLQVAVRQLAIFGGTLVCVMALLTTVSVTGRLFGMPVPGDYEMVAVLCGSAVFAFLPYCQLTRGNVVVEFFVAGAPPRVRLACDVLGNLLYLALALLLTWRLIYGAADMYHYGEKTTVINFPRWTTFPFDIVCMIVLVAVTAYTLARSLAGWWRSEPPVPAPTVLE
jgi:TRAP-type C4-dicarboxylate transport system permease small subunit